ncbi:CCA tRNA nucleotidyltransferase [candidate division WOR-3 bacterium]|nr:CCA tRNA nucleotidyltransferase [candidate division WOR-3 bacterium]
MTNSRTRANDEQPPLALPNRTLLERLGEIADHLGTRSFLVGGPVRDLILGRPSPDLDVAVEVGTREFGAAVAKELGGRFVFHSRFLTGTVLFDRPIADRQPPVANPSSPAPRPAPLSHIDITQTRAETYERPAVLPAVRPASIVGDLGRRDFTINAMAMEITPGSFGTFIDPFDGRDDIAQRRVRILHARSFIDDPTRIFRCIRFATRLGFTTEPRTRELMHSAVKERLPAFLTPERVLYELRLICAEPGVVPMVRTLVREKVLKAAWRWTPPAGFLPGFARLAAIHPSSLSTSSLLFIYWLSVLPVTDRFPIRKEERDAAEAVAGFGRLRPRLKHKLKPSAAYKALRSLPEKALQISAALETKTVSANIRAFLDSYRKVRIATTGADLRGAGLVPGPAYRKILDELLFARLDGRIRTVTEERRMLARLMRRLGTRATKT